MFKIKNNFDGFVKGVNKFEKDIALVQITDDGMFQPKEGEAMKLDDETFVKMLHGGKIKFQADKLREV